MEIPIFYGIKGENPKEWTDQVEKYLLKIGIKDDKRIFEIARTHLLDNAKEWLENEGMCIADWNKNKIKWLNLKFRIVEKYSITLSKEELEKYLQGEEKIEIEICDEENKVVEKKVIVKRVNKNVNDGGRKRNDEESVRNKIEMLYKEYFLKEDGTS
ncbi:hypothetical protein RhiirA4_482314 [Rhizophagus irregularis]|uniref:Uncharacterized protein n=1 Tax=Rhizophagus irregularis TaxID=588596 RepID=A0A2I1HKV9_9GLOM|nr:hypothetical protein RhiirA4_482314 [Rhizophagus irregularis]